MNDIDFFFLFVINFNIEIDGTVVAANLSGFRLIYLVSKQSS